MRAIHVFLEAPSTPVEERFDAARLAEARDAARVGDRADPRRRVRPDGVAVALGLLRLPGRRAPLPAPRLEAELVSERLAVFAYGSLVSAESAARTLGRPVPAAPSARLEGFTRDWSLARDNLRSEKTFERPDGSLPAWCLGLNVVTGGAGAGAERRPDRGHRGRARAARPSRDPLPPPRGRGRRRRSPAARPTGSTR